MVMGTASDAKRKLAALLYSPLTRGIARIMRQGLTRHQLSLAVAIALTASIFPFFFFPTLLCLSFAALMRLNPPIMQSVNYLAGPLQILLFLPFMRIGAFVLGQARHSLDLLTLRQALVQDPGGMLIPLCAPIGHAMMGWLVAAPFVFVLAYGVLYSVLRAVPGNRLEATGTCPVGVNGNPYLTQYTSASNRSG